MNNTLVALLAVTGLQACAVPASTPTEPALSAPVPAAPARGTAPTQDPEAPWHPIFGPAKQKVVQFCEGLKNRNHDRVSVAVLPFVYSDQKYDPTPWAAPQGGLDVADGVADILRGLMPEADVLGPTEIALRLDDLAIDPTTFRTARGARDGGHHLGVDVVLFGSVIRRSKRGGASTATELLFRMQAVRIAGGGRAPRMEWRVGSQDRTVADLFAGLREETEWRVVDRLPVPKDASFASARGSAIKRFSGRIGRLLGGLPVGSGKSSTPGGGDGGNSGAQPGGRPSADPTRGRANDPASGPTAKPGDPGHQPRANPKPHQPAVKAEPAKAEPKPAASPEPAKPGEEPHREWRGVLPQPSAADRNLLVTPASFSVLVDQEKQLLAAQTDLRKEYYRIVAAARQRHAAPDLGSPVTVGGREWSSYSEAKAHVAKLSLKVRESKAGEFCLAFSREVKKALGAGPEGRVILPSNYLDEDLLSDLTAQLQANDLSEQSELVQQLRAKKLGTVVVPYLEDCGSYYAIRARIVDLRDPAAVRTVFVTIDSKFKEQLQAQLGV